jgi:hypothetical protein
VAQSGRMITVMMEESIESPESATDQETERAWNREIARRVSELDSGKAKTLSWQEVQQRISDRCPRTPETLLRFFDNEGYACSFVRGEIRFGLLDHYRVIEGSRQDDTEGRVAFEWNQKAPQVIIVNGKVVDRRESDQNIRYSGSSLNPYFILSTSHPEADVRELAEKFGQFVVRINDPQAFLERVKDCWRSHSWACAGSAWIAPVVYNKGGLLEPDPYLIAPSQYSYSQKPSTFEKEREFRFVLECTVGSRNNVNQYLTLTLPNCDDILTLERSPFGIKT